MPLTQTGARARILRGALKLIEHPLVRQLVESFESTAPPPARLTPEATGHIPLDGEHPIERVVAIDGGQGPQYNLVRREEAITAR